MSDWSSDVCSSDLTDAAPLTPADAEEADRRATMAQPVGVVLHTADSDFSHYHSFNHSYDPTVGAPHADLEAALTSAGLTRIGDVVGDGKREYGAMWETAIERLSPVFGLAPDAMTTTNAHLERKGVDTEARRVGK